MCPRPASFLALSALLFAAPAARAADGDPLLAGHLVAAPDVLEIVFRTGRVIPAVQRPYEPREGDRFTAWKKRGTRILVRDGREVGALVGPEGKILMPFDDFIETPLDLAWLSDPEHYLLTSPDDPEFKISKHPVSVGRKSRPTGLARTGEWRFRSPAEHRFYLRFGAPIKGGRHYTLSFDGDRFEALGFEHDPYVQRSESVHVSQVGFHPDDPLKVGFLSLWMGDGGPCRFDPTTEFHLVDTSSGRTVFKAPIALAKAATEQNEDPYRRNYNGTDVYRLDFSEFRTPGHFRLYVEGVGCSYPFPIDAGVWARAFRHAVRGFYHQRSGIALGPPFTDFTRPRCFHPDDGVVVTHSTCPLMDSGNGLNARGTDTDNFGNLLRGRTDRPVPDAWGGYFDAGDWDRRIQHLRATRLLLELLELFPERAAQTALNIPESGNALPDLLDEALWNLSCYRRMQTPEGGVSGGIESAEHPRYGEGSWQESQPVMAYAPGAWSSYVYAGDAARAARLLHAAGSDQASGWYASALRAMEWAEARTTGPDAPRLPHAVRDARNLAAAELFRLSGLEPWHRVFLETTVFTNAGASLAEWKHHDQRDAAFVYVRTGRPSARPEIRAAALEAILNDADRSARMAVNTAFGWTKLNPWQPVAWGILSVPQATTILRAHALTGDPRYLRAALLAAQTGVGANPLNLCYTTGLGHVSPRHPLWTDARVLNRPPPPGLTVYGPMDTRRHGDYFGFQIVADSIHPPIAAWPTIEAWFDVFLSPGTCEFTVDGTLAPNTYVWGHLAFCDRPAAPGEAAPAAE